MKKIINLLLLFPPYFKPRFIASDYISDKCPGPWEGRDKWLLYQFLLIVLGIEQFIFFFPLVLFLVQINPFLLLLVPYLLLLMVRWNQYWGINS